VADIGGVSDPLEESLSDLTSLTSSYEPKLLFI